MKKYVLTGGPEIGKTTAIEILASMDYDIIPESARIIIEEEKIKGSDVLPWKNLQKFQERVADLQMQAENKTHDKDIFLDRSIVDGYAYCKIGNVAPPEIIEKIARNRYEKFFVLEPLNSYELDGTRYENESEARKTHETIIESYRHFGYDLISVPVSPPKERVEFILKNI